MSATPVLLVLEEAPPVRLTRDLAAAGFNYRVVSGAEAVHLAASDQLLLCQRVPAWQALIARVDGAGGAAVLWGPPLQHGEHKGLVPPHLEVVDEVTGVVPALVRARVRIQAAASPLQMSQRLTERMESAERVSRFAQSIATHIDLPGVIHEAIAKTRELCEADGASLLLVDRQTGELHFDTVAGGIDAPIRSIRLKPGQGIAGKVAQEATPWLVSDVRQAPDFDSRSDQASGFATGSIIAVPLLFGGDVIGVLEAVRRQGKPGFEKYELRRLEDLAPHVTIAVHNAQLTESLRELQSQVLGANVELERKVQIRTQQIAEAKREWELTFDAISEPIALQEGFVLRRTNAAYAKRVGLPITEVTGKTCHRVLAGRETPCPECPMLAGRNGAEMTGEVEMKGNARLLFSGFWMSSDSSDSRVVAHYRDITKQRLLEERLRESERLAALGQLASGAAHEINNPLGFLTSNLNSLRDSLEDLGEIQDLASKALQSLRSGEAKEAARVLDEIEELDGEALLQDGGEMISESLEGAHRVGEIVKALRELSKFGVERGDPCLVNASVTRVVHAELGEKSPAVVLDLRSQTKAQIPPLQMDQTLAHVLRNARQAVSQGQKIWVQTTDAEGQVVVEIRDEGCGIPPENLRRVFEPFFTTRGVGQGIGLGLTAAYGIVKRNGGSIDVRSTIGQGTTVTLRLPQSKMDEAPP